MSPTARRPRANADSVPVVARGAPRRIRYRLPLKPAERGVGAGVDVTIEGAEIHGVTLFPPRAAHPGHVRLSLRLGPSTPPGYYPGTVRIGEQTVPIAAEVERWPRLEAEPNRLVVSAAPGGVTTARVGLVNVGNVPCEIPAVSTFCLFDGSGIEHAVWVALTNEPTPEKQRIDLLLDDLASSHGGLVRARATKGHGVIAPGQAREVTLQFRFSERLEPGRKYVGAWDLDGLRVRVRVTGVEPETETTPDEAQRA